jgi:hypothetical protein
MTAPAFISSSVVTLRPKRAWPTCLRCGTTLAGRLEAVRNGGPVETEVFRCRCGQGRHIRRGVTT